MSSYLSYKYLTAKDKEFSEAMNLVQEAYINELQTTALPLPKTCAAVFRQGKVVGSLSVTPSTSLDAMEFPSSCRNWETAKAFLMENRAFFENKFVEVGRHAVHQDWRKTDVNDELIEKTFMHLRATGQKYVLAVLGLHVAVRLNSRGYSRYRFGAPDPLSYNLSAAETDGLRNYYKKSKVQCCIISTERVGANSVTNSIDPS